MSGVEIIDLNSGVFFWVKHAKPLTFQFVNELVTGLRPPEADVDPGNYLNLPCTSQVAHSDVPTLRIDFS